MATTRTRANAPKLANWTTNQSIGNSSFTTVWSSPPDPGDPLVFIKSVFQLNTDKMYMKVTCAGDVKLDVDLEEIGGDFKLFKEAGVAFPIMRYESPNLWIYQPSDSLLIGSGELITIQLKSKAGTKKAVRGMTEWGEL